MSRIVSIVMVAVLLGVVGTASAGSAAPAGAPPSGQGPVFRPYGGAGGLKAEFAQLAASNPGVAQLVTIGRSVRGTDIVALKVTRNPRTTRDGRRPATLFLGGQHAEEWIGVETVRRLAHHVVEGYSSDPVLADLVGATELWFVPVENPDGYDFSFTPGNRNWRKNLRDSDRDGRITAVDGVDLNRNFPTKWGYDEEGSSPSPGAEDYRGTRPASEPETRAVDGLDEARGLRVHAQLPRLQRGAAVRHGVAGGDAHARRRRVRGAGRRRRRPGGARLWPRACGPTCTPPTARPTSTPPWPTAPSA